MKPRKHCPPDTPQGPDIFDVDHLMGSGNGAETALRVRLERRGRQRGGVGGWHIVEGNETVAPILVKVHWPKLAPQMRVAFSSIFWNTGSRSPGVLLMT